MIEVEHLTKYYGDYPALRDVNFNVERGEILGFLGPNGAGKTTTMRIITGYLPPSSGTVRVAGFDIVDKSIEARRHLGYLPETVPLYTDLTTYEYLDFRARICGLINARERKARINEVMDQLHISDVSKRLVGQLSRGYRQRVGLAQSMIHNPDVLIMDEPTVGLDPVQITDVRSLIRELGQNHTIILSTHLLPEVSMVCNRVIIINRGRLVAVDTPINLAEGISEALSVQLEVNGRPADVLRTLRSIPGVSAASVVRSGVGPLPSGNGLPPADELSDDGLPEGIYTYDVEGTSGIDVRGRTSSAVVGAGYELLELRGVRLSLEEVFLRVVAQGAEADAAEDEEYGDYDGDQEYTEDGDYGEEEYEEPEEVVRPERRSVRVAPRKVRK
jgi:ABC-2 type transport system ATP-binding protein